MPAGEWILHARGDRLDEPAEHVGLVVGASKAGVPLFLGSYPITPASDILHYLAAFKAHGVCPFQAEDEIAAITSAIGASFGGSIGLTTTSGPDYGQPAPSGAVLESHWIAASWGGGWAVVKTTSPMPTIRQW